jgi:hypothetical protein
MFNFGFYRGYNVNITDWKKFIVPINKDSINGDIKPLSDIYKQQEQEHRDSNGHEFNIKDSNQVKG